MKRLAHILALFSLGFAAGCGLACVLRGEWFWCVAAWGLATAGWCWLEVAR